MDHIKNFDLFDLEKTIAAPLLRSCDYPWDALAQIHGFIINIGRTLSLDEYDLIDTNIWIAKDADISPKATILGPTIIESNSEIRPGAYIRGNVVIGKYCTIGNSCEIKNSIIFDHAQIPHFNYIGDSILGYCAHTGAGVITSNVKCDRSVIKIRYGNNDIETKLRKLGAMIGDHVEIGCNSVLNPGTIIGRYSTIYPLSSVRGTVEPNRIYKSESNIVIKK